MVRLEPSSSITRSVEAGTGAATGAVADGAVEVAPARPLPERLGLAASSFDEHPAAVTATQTAMATSASTRRPPSFRARAETPRRPLPLPVIASTQLTTRSYSPAVAAPAVSRGLTGELANANLPASMFLPRHKACRIGIPELEAHRTKSVPQ